MNELYKKEICINCANEECANRIEETKKLELVGDQMSTTTIIKCKDFICKNKRPKKNKKDTGW